MKKKALTVILSLCVALAMTACDGNTDTAGVEETAVVEESTEADTQAEEEAKAEAEAKAQEEAEELERLEEANECYEAGRKSLYGLNGAQIDMEDAYTNFIKAQELGNTDANFYLGVLADWYGYPEQDYEQARAYYEQCEDNPYAQISLEFLYCNFKIEGLDIYDLEKGQELFQSVVDQGVVEGYLGLAALSRDYETALGDYQKVVEEGTEQLYVAYAMNNIAKMYQYGEGVEQDYTTAIEWYTKAADLGDSDAMLCIAQMYDWGDGMEQDDAKAVEWYTKAADANNSAAMCRLGVMYGSGEGVDQDFDMEMEWYQKAADLGNTQAMENIALLYKFGVDGVAQDGNAAIEWYQKAADSGDSSALGQIGDMYRDGDGVERNDDVALEWYAKSLSLDPSVFVVEDIIDILHGEDAAMEWFAESGDTETMIAIGDMYCNSYGSGRIIQQLPDYNKAMEWYQKALDLGNEEAKARIESMQEQ